MVKLKIIRKNSRKITISREWRDNLEQILVLFMFILTTIVLIVIESIKKGEMLLSWFCWLFILILLLFYYILPNSSLTLDLDNNKWYIKRMLFFIPIKFSAGKISNISSFTLHEIIEFSYKKKFKLSFDKTKYISSYELWKFSDEKGNQEKIKIFIKNSYSYSSHKREIQEISSINKKLENILHLLGIPIDCYFFNEEKNL